MTEANDYHQERMFSRRRIAGWNPCNGIHQVAVRKQFGVASWVQAVGAMIAIAVAIYVPYRQRTDGDIRDRKRDDQRRQEPLMTLRPIMERALILIENIPRKETTDIYVEHFWSFQAFTWSPDQPGEHERHR